ncbi:lantibiotic dehydratase [Kitasatospora terrestris]|uniref:Lantibiotic dehydratase N-terminal domain-containing protein n=1 Tax=Kitasatospora terrestris TaxID=258051 RepID=A0ABP9DGN7_9ACTN
MPTFAVPSPAEPAAPPHPSASAGGWVLADSVMLRINPTPGRRLAAPELRTALSALAESEQRCARLADPACDSLYKAIAHAEGADRHRLLHLRRAVHNDRDPGPGPWPEPLPEPVTAWLDADDRRRLARTAVRTGHAAFLAHERVAFADVLGSEPFQLSLALNSPQVLDAVQRYRKAAGRASARDRKSERGLVQHWTRAVVRVSPLARLTAVAFAEWADDGTPLDQVRFARRDARSVLGLDQPQLSGLVNGILQAPEHTSPTVLARNPMLRVEGDRIRFHHHSDGQGRMLAAELNRELTVLLRLTEMGPLTPPELAAATADRLGVPVEAAGTLITAAVRAQILIPAPLLDEQSTTLLADATAALATGHGRAAELLDGIGAELTRAARAAVPERVAALSRIERAGRELNTLSAVPVRLRVNEDHLLPPTPVSPGGHATALGELPAVGRFLHLFDRHHDVRALLVRAFTDRFGTGGQAPLLDHAPELVAEVRARQQRVETDPAAAEGVLAQLHRARTRAEGALTELLERSRADGLAEARLTAAELAALADGLPEECAGDSPSYGLLVQPAGADRLVVNACYPGSGQLTTRFLDTADQDGVFRDRLRERLHRLHSGRGEQPVEDHGLHGSNLNHRLPLLERRLTPQDWVRARLVHDPATDRLVLLDGDGQPIRVLSLGMKWIDAQPAPLLVAAWLHGPSLVAFDPVERAHRTAARPLGDTAPTVRYPRLVAGDCILQRRRWYPGEDLPAPTAPVDEVADLLALTAWRARHEVPEQIVVKTPLWRLPGMARPGEESAAPRIEQIIAARRREKPQYLDLASALMVRVLPRLMERRHRGYFEEALPEVRNGANAFEWAVEVDREATDR